VADPSGAVVTDQQISQGAGATPVTLTVQGNEQLLPKLAFAAYDGTAAAGNFLPVVRFIGPGGQIAGQAVGDVVTAGASVDQTWFRGLAKQTGTPGSLTATTEYARNGGTTSVPGDGSGGWAIQWAHTAGTANLLDYTTPTAPTIITAGIYAVTVNVFMATATFTSPSVMAVFLQVGSSAFLKGVCPLATNVFGGFTGVDTPEVVLSMPPLNLVAGDALQIGVAQGSGGALDFALQSPVGAVITQLS
jgi:hypothetical protein